MRGRDCGGALLHEGGVAVETARRGGVVVGPGLGSALGSALGLGLALALTLTRPPGAAAAESVVVRLPLDPGVLAGAVGPVKLRVRVGVRDRVRVRVSVRGNPNPNPNPNLTR